MAGKSTMLTSRFIFLELKPKKRVSLDRSLISLGPAGGGCGDCITATNAGGL